MSIDYDELIRQSVALIKSRFTRWGGSVVLPADSVIEDCVKEILSLSYAIEEK